VAPSVRVWPGGRLGLSPRISGHSHFDSQIIAYGSFTNHYNYCCTSSDQPSGSIWNASAGIPEPHGGSPFPCPQFANADVAGRSKRKGRTSDAAHAACFPAKKAMTSLGFHRTERPMRIGSGSSRFDCMLRMVPGFSCVYAAMSAAVQSG
jgi:hypothetical protein